MSYLGYTKIVSKYLQAIKNPFILEIGVDKGQTSIPLIHNLVMTKNKFKWVGVDVRQDDCLVNQLTQMHGVSLFLNKGNEINCNAVYNIANSLDVLPVYEKRGTKFDLIMIDGDHNYATVSKELSYINDICHESSWLLIDDYNGRWSTKDLFYKNRKSHKSNDLLEKNQVNEEKAGVKAAVDDWLANQTDWTLLDNGYDCVIAHKKHVSVSIRPGSTPHLMDATLLMASAHSNTRFDEQYRNLLNNGNALKIIEQKKQK